MSLVKAALARALSVAALLASTAVMPAMTTSCSPVGLAGASCKDAPCALGLTCVEQVCTKVTPPPPPPPPCTQDSDCVLDGSADGRVCNTDDGTCSFATCFIDAQCGTRICDQGQCAPNVPCFGDGDCADSQICNNGSCRAACVADADCPAVGPINLATCVDGQCLQRCLNDQTCLTGGICENNTCLDPQCAVDDDCADAGPGNYFCNGGRCEQFTPCSSNADCFDPNFQCNDLGRCEERPACNVDGECGLGLCVAQHCRDAVPCAAASDCPPSTNPTVDEECVAGRCVDAPGCRSSAECDAVTPGDVCESGRCTAAPAAVDASVVVVRTPLGPCFAGHTGACAVPAFVGDVVSLYAQGFDTDGTPITAAIDLATTSSAPHTIDAAGRATVTCDSAGTKTATFDGAVGGVGGPDDASVVDVDVRCIAGGTDALDVVAYESSTGAALAGAHVFVDDVEVGVTSSDGVFASTTFTSGTAGVKTDDGRGFVVVDAAPGRLFVPLAPDAADAAGAAGFRALVNGTGDELGDVGLAFALPEVASPSDASLENVMGEPFPALITLPVIGGLPVALPSSSIMDATLPLSGQQEVKPEAFDTAAPGPAATLAYEGRFAQQFLFNVAFGADPTNTALDFAAQAEGMDVKLAGVGVLEEAPLVVDANDVDGDGDTAELVPDFASFPEISAEPESGPSERVGLVTSAPPQGANARSFAVCGVELPHAFLPLGVASLFGADAGEQLKLLSSSSAVDGAPHTCTAHAVTGDPATTSFVVARGDAFAAVVDAGAFLAPPAGAFVLAGVPAADRSSVVVPDVAGADVVSVAIFDGAVTWTVVGAARGSVPLPAYIDPVVLAGTKAYRLPAATTSASLASATRSLDDIASALATSP